MTVVKYESGLHEIFNVKGNQLRGMPAQGMDGGLNPREMMEAAVGLCMTLTITAILDRDGKLSKETVVNIDVEGEKNAENENRYTDLIVKVELPEDLDEAYRKKLIAKAKNGCTIGNTLMKSVNIETIIVK